MIIYNLTLRSSKHGKLKEVVIVGDTQDNTLRYKMLLEFNYQALGFKDQSPNQPFITHSEKVNLKVCTSYNIYFREFTDLEYLVYFVADDYATVGKIESDFNMIMSKLGFNILDNEQTIVDQSEDIE